MTARKTADLPVLRGTASPVQFRRMVEMSGAIATLIVRDQGPLELLNRLSDPFWFQAFGCVVGYDWHSSGITTAVCAALKEASRKFGRDLGVVICGGKGATSRRTPDEIRRACDRSGDQAEPLIYASRLGAKVDSACVQDGYEIYHHTFIFVPGAGTWSLIQQGTNTTRRHARRYHWNSGRMTSFVSEPHAAVACDRRGTVLNLVAGEATRHRQAMAALAREHPDRILREVRAAVEAPSLMLEGAGGRRKAAELPARHRPRARDLNPQALKKVLVKTFESQACDFEELVGAPGLGADSLRSVSILAELIYQAPASHRDPAAYSFAHGGKDGQPYTVNRAPYDLNLERLRQAVGAAKLGDVDKAKAMKALSEFTARMK